MEGASSVCRGTLCIHMAGCWITGNACPLIPVLNIPRHSSWVPLNASWLKIPEQKPSFPRFQTEQLCLCPLFLRSGVHSYSKCMTHGEMPLIDPFFRLGCRSVRTASLSPMNQRWLTTYGYPVGMSDISSVSHGVVHSSSKGSHFNHGEDWLN